MKIRAGAVGLKLHPSYDEYPADTPGLDPFLEIAAEARVPVTVHTGPGPSDPDLIRKLAERFPAGARDETGAVRALQDEEMPS